MSGRARAATAGANRLQIRSFLGVCSGLLCCGLLTAPCLGAPPPGSDADPKLTPETVIQRLQEIEAVTLQIDPQTPLQTRTPRLVFSLGNVDQLVAIVPPTDRIRYVALELIAVNPTAEAQTLDVESVRLRSGGQLLRWQDRHSKINGMHFRVGEHNRLVRDTEIPDALSIPAHSAVSQWLVFSGLEVGPFVPDLTLEVPGPDQTLSLDVRQFERGVLKLHTERWGPADCLAVLTVSGELNSVNAGSLVEELDRLCQQGIVRTVIVIGPQAAPISRTIADWLIQWGQEASYATGFRELPPLPTMLLERRVVFLQSNAAGVANDGPTLEEAVSQSLESAFSRVDAETVLQALRGENAYVRAAALQHGAARLDAGHLPALARLLTAPQPEVRLAAIKALGQFGDAEAISLLVSQVKSSEPSAAETATRALAASGFPAAHRALQELIQTGISLPPQELVRILSLNARPTWEPIILELAQTGESKVRQAAIQALTRLGHPQLVSVLEQGLQSSDDRVREEAFTQLVNLQTRESDDLAIAYTLERLRTAPPSAAMHQFLERIRDPRAVPLLVPYLDGPDGARRTVIDLLAKIGDQTVAAELAARYDRLSDSEKVQTLQALTLLDSDQGVELALRSLRSEDVTLVQNAVQVVQQEGTDVVVQNLHDATLALRGRTGVSAIGHLCTGLGAIGTPTAQQALLDLRDTDDEAISRWARQGLQVLWNQSPAHDLVSLADVKIRFVERLQQTTGSTDEMQPPNEAGGADRQELMDTQLQLAERQLDAAAQLDDNLPELSLQKGKLLKLRGDQDGAVRELEHAVELNDELLEAHVELGQVLADLERFDQAIPHFEYAFEHDSQTQKHQTLTAWALALVRHGQLEEALDLIRKYAEQLPSNAVFEYNQACVYGRAYEWLRKDSEVPQDDPRLAVFAEEAVRMLKEAFDHGLAQQTGVADMHEFMRNDPDLKSLHGVSAFRKLAELDRPPEERTPPMPVPEETLPNAPFQPL
ncbi:MAG: HEAT repeat domain-containing protein [Planctomycetaceae bacterium]|nr:HEAT repeat domain-containing protein [Planctomycetaceae bacterium]